MQSDSSVEIHKSFSSNEQNILTNYSGFVDKRIAYLRLTEIPWIHLKYPVLHSQVFFSIDYLSECTHAQLDDGLRLSFRDGNRRVWQVSPINYRPRIPLASRYIIKALPGAMLWFFSHYTMATVSRSSVLQARVTSDAGCSHLSAGTHPV